MSDRKLEQILKTLTDEKLQALIDGHIANSIGRVDDNKKMVAMVTKITGVPPRRTAVDTRTALIEKITGVLEDDGDVDPEIREALTAVSYDGSGEERFTQIHEAVVARIEHLLEKDPIILITLNNVHTTPGGQS